MTEIKIAKKFCGILNTWLSPVEIAKINELNASEDSSICHTHDFIDANEAMIEAFEFFDLDPIDDIELCNKAWDIAKAAGFDGDKICAA